MKRVNSEPEQSEGCTVTKTVKSEKSSLGKKSHEFQRKSEEHACLLPSLLRPCSLSFQKNVAN